MPNPLEDTIERLCTEFGSLLDPDTLAEVVDQCCRELNTTPEFARPELVERLARKRLGDTNVYTFTGVADHGPAAGSSVRLVVRW